MKKRLHRILSILCVLALTISCFASFAALAEEAQIVIISVQWDDENNYDAKRPASLDITIGDARVTLSDANGWTGEALVPADVSWDLPAVETYTRSIQSAGDAVIATYKHVVAKTALTGQVAWNDGDNAYALRPESVQLRLLADGEPYGVSRTVNAAGGWAASWDGLPVTKEGSETPIVYTVSEDAPEGYSVSVDGLTARNTIKTGRLILQASVTAPEGADVSGLSLTVSGPEFGNPVTLTLGEIGGSFDFGQVLPGAYVVQENNADTLLEGYVMDPAASNVGDAVNLKPGETATLNFRYTYREPVAEDPNEDPMAATGSLIVEINGPDPRMPMTVTYSLFADGKYELDGLLPGSYSVVERNAEGLVRAYTLTSDSVTGLSISVGKEGAVASLFNQYVPAPTPQPEPELIDIPVTKTWVDNNNQDGNRPDSITVHLFADGTEVDSLVMTAAGGWVATFTEKPRTYEDGTEIQYTVNEDPVQWYAASVSGRNITNTYQPEFTTAVVRKEWDDNNNNNGQGVRPTSLAVTLHPLGTVYVLSADNGWTVTAENLPKYINGQEAVYSWTEQETLHYVRESVTTEGNVTTFRNRLTRVPEPPAGKKPPKKPGGEIAIFEEYPTALGVEVYINHVGDCFD